MRAMRRFGSDWERRRRRANALYVFEMLLREEGLSDFVYDEEKDLFRFSDGRFAFSREWADPGEWPSTNRRPYRAYLVSNRVRHGGAKSASFTRGTA